MSFPVCAIQHDNIGATHEPMNQCAWLTLIDFRLGEHVYRYPLSTNRLLHLLPFCTWLHQELLDGNGICQHDAPVPYCRALFTKDESRKENQTRGGLTAKAPGERFITGKTISLENRSMEISLRMALKKVKNPMYGRWRR